MTSRLTGAVLFALATSLCAPEALAQGGRGSVAVLSVEITGDAPPELRPQLQRSLAGGLSAGGARVVTLDEVSAALADRPELVGCTSTTCLAEVASLVGAKRFVKARIDAAGSTYLIELELLSPDADGAVVSRVERDCTVCSIMEANNDLSEAARDLLRTDPVRSVALVVVSEPPGAQVEVDGVAVGSTPFEGELGPGEHRVSVRKAGFADSYRTVEVQPRGKPQPVELEFELAPARALVRDQEVAPRPYRTLKWVAGGGAAGALITGAVLLAIDGNDISCDRDPGQTQCPDQRETTIGGVAMLAASAALGGVSGWMFWSDHQTGSGASHTTGRGTQRFRTASVALTPGGGVATVRLRF